MQRQIVSDAHTGWMLTMVLASQAPFNDPLPTFHRLAGKTAIVTGAGQGIGEAIAHALAAEGAHTIVAEINPVTAAQVAQDITTRFGPAGVQAVPYVLDVADHAAVSRMVDEVAARFGQIDILIGNAGVNERVDLMDVTVDGWNTVMHTNLEGAFFSMQTVARHMLAHARPERRSNGKIVNIASVAGRQGRPGAPQYSASKAGLISITQAAAHRLAPQRINVNAVCPGLVITPMWEEIDSTETARRNLPRGEWLRRRVDEKVPLRRAATVQDVAGVVVFLCTAEADYITGQSIHIDGGYEMP